MGRRVQLRGADSAAHSGFVGAERELTIDTTKKTAVVHDGTTAGGIPLAKESVTNDHENRLVKIEGDGDVVGSITNKINNAVNALKDGVDIDVDTLKELSDAINSTETDAATSLANSIASLRNELKNGATGTHDTFKEVEDFLNAMQTEIDDRFTKSEAKGLFQDVDGNILPRTSGAIDIGSETKRFRGIYVDEAYLSTNTLYIGDTPVLGTDADTVVVKADEDQSILVKTTGTGSTGIQSQHEVQISTSGVNADVKVQATGNNSKVRFAGLGGIELSNNTTVQADLDVTGNVNFGGIVTLSGEAFIVDSETVKTKDNIIVLNDGEVGSGVTAGKAGIQIDRGDAAAFQLVFDEVTDKFIVGPVGGSFETLTTKEHVTSVMLTETNIRVLAEAALQSGIDVEKNRIDAILEASNADKNSFKEIVDLINAESSTRSSADDALQANINVEKGRIDAILDSSLADKNSFKEIVDLINSVDTTNDNAFAAYVTSNNERVTGIEDDLSAEVTDRTNAINSLTSIVTANNTARTNQGNTNAAAIVTETNNRIADVNIETTNRINADNNLQGAIDQETSLREENVSVLTNRIDTLLDVVDCGSIV